MKSRDKSYDKFLDKVVNNISEHKKTPEKEELKKIFELVSKDLEKFPLERKNFKKLLTIIQKSP